jgi:hypothetical protein
VEVNQPHRPTRHRRGKSGAIDAEAAARKVLAEEATAVPKDTTGMLESIRQLRAARASAVKARTAALTQLGELTVTAPPSSERSSVARRSAARPPCARGCARIAAAWPTCSGRRRRQGFS